MSQCVSDQLLNLGPLTTDANQSGFHANTGIEAEKKTTTTQAYFGILNGYFLIFLFVLFGVCFALITQNYTKRREISEQVQEIMTDSEDLNQVIIRSHLLLVTLGYAER